MRHPAASSAAYKTRFGRRLRCAAEITVYLFFDAVAFHGKEHKKEIPEPQFPVTRKILSRVNRTF